ncbi:hypothetical protein SJAG_01130 [Schizosaccharomyces japonicus yFS275]|uniref:Uncharacterized protein n=2 Tax=Schizosaccharomyces japonicus TaxID=4897 RepID=B6JZU0_SCHJY|nr:hypothetical protein SJAG_01130 [Schizosaccharomyces japonicus yFS275]EEB06090.1 hypothetical protein SJAG_01130 [Schizosaccharomyces japonicus yFS275]BAI77475.1 hypothetical protein [Schizosaccharomyces japonicus]
MTSLAESYFWSTDEGQLLYNQRLQVVELNTRNLNTQKQLLARRQKLDELRQRVQSVQENLVSEHGRFVLEQHELQNELQHFSPDAVAERRRANELSHRQTLRQCRQNLLQKQVPLSSFLSLCTGGAAAAADDTTRSPENVRAD